MTERVWPDPDCGNCDGRGCMDCVLRYWHDQCVDDCPDCCPVHVYACPICGDETGSTQVVADRRCRLDGAVTQYVGPRWGGAA